MMVKCDRCGYEMSTLVLFAKPVVEFQRSNGRSIKMCYDCLCQYGELANESETDPKAREEYIHFLDGLGEEGGAEDEKLSAPE